MRLNKFIAHSGVASRRRADQIIQEGRVTVNGRPAENGYDVRDGDQVAVDGKPIRPEKKKVYLMMNKPAGYITTVSDDRDRATVMDLLQDIPERIYPVGRLDRNTSGLLILTNDGELANHLMHPSNEIRKTYHAVVSGMFSRAEAERLRRGVDIGDRRPTAPAEVEILKQGSGRSEAIVTIREGRNREVRRMFQAIGHDVLELKRLSVGNLELGHLKPGRTRKLSPAEVRYLLQL